jgi:transitional endoplasmic reticulum ATPase
LEDGTALASFITQKRFPIYEGFRFDFWPPGSGRSIPFEVLTAEDAQGRTPECGQTSPETTVRWLQGPLTATTPATPAAYERIGGMDQQVQLVRQSIELPLRMRQAMRGMGVSTPRGVIFHGPPGTGKTLLAGALAQAVGAELIVVDPTRLLSQYRGQAEEMLSEIFDRAEAAEEGAVIVIDEIDLIAARRDQPEGPASSGLVTVLLNRMDRLDPASPVLVIGTTNRIESLDEAIRRHGRFSREVALPAPDERGRAAILRIHSRCMPLEADTEEQREALLERIARRTQGFVGADLMELCREAGVAALSRAHPLSALDAGDLSPRCELRVGEADFRAALAGVRPSAMKEAAVSVPDVGFEDICGLEEVVSEIHQRVLQPLEHAEAFAAAGIGLERGILLHGPPGSGKTLLAKAIARQANANFLLVRGPELLSKWVGQSEEGLRRVFSRARQVRPAVVFFDEIEALLPVRGSGHDSGVSDRIVNQFLAEVDGMVEMERVLLIGATNRPELIDPAALRAGRLGLHLRVPLPDRAGRAAILRHDLGAMGQAIEAEELDLIAQQTQGWSGAELAGLIRDAKREALQAGGFQPTSSVSFEHLQGVYHAMARRRGPLRS